MMHQPLPVILVVIAGADAGIDKHRKQLSSFDQLWVASVDLVRLNVEQEPTVTEDIACVDDTR